MLIKSIGGGYYYESSFYYLYYLYRREWKERTEGKVRENEGYKEKRKKTLEEEGRKE